MKLFLLQGIRRFIPSIKLKANPHPKWFTPNLRHQLKCIHTLRRRYQPLISRIIYNSENQFALECSATKSSFESNLINIILSQAIKQKYFNI